MRRIRQLILPIGIFQRQISRSSGFRKQTYKRLDYPKAPSVLKSDRAPDPVAEEFTVVKRTEKKTGKEKKETEDEAEFVFETEKEALEFSLAPLEEKLQRYETRLEKLHKEHAEHLHAQSAEIDRNGGVFAVRRGLVPGIYLHWNKVAQETHQVVGSEWQKFDSVTEAREWMGKYKVSAGDACYDPFKNRIAKMERLVDTLRAEQEEKEQEEDRKERESKASKKSKKGGSKKSKGDSKKSKDDDFWYAVKKGRETGIFSNWEDAADQVIGFKDPVYARFRNRTEAILFLGMSRREYFDSLKQDPKKTDEEMVAHRKAVDEREAAYRREQQRVNFRDFFDIEFFANKPKNGHVAYVKQKLAKLLQIQAEINKMVYLDKKRKFFIRGAFDDFNQLTEEEREELLDSIKDDNILLKTYRLFTVPEYQAFHKEFLQQENYVVERNSEHWGEPEKENRELKQELEEEEEELELFSPDGKFFGPSDVLVRRQQKELRLIEEEEKRKKEQEKHFEAVWRALDRTTPPWKKKKDPLALDEDEWYNPFGPMKEPENTEQFQLKEKLVRDAGESGSSGVSLADLAKLKCKCGEPVYNENDDLSIIEPLIPRTFLYLDPKKYPTLHCDNGSKIGFRGNAHLFCARTSDFRDHFIKDHHTALVSNWEVMHMAICRRLATLAAYYDKRYDSVDAHVIYTDGSYNPRWSTAEGVIEGRAGWGVHFEDKEFPDACGRVPGDQSSQKSELVAILIAVRIITRDLVGSSSKHWEIRTDSLMAMRAIESGWDGLEPLPVIRADPNYYLIKRLRELMMEHQNITLKWVSGRQMWVGNQVADKLAKKGAKMDHEKTSELYGALAGLDSDVLIEECEDKVMNNVSQPLGLWVPNYIPNRVAYED